MMFEVITKPKDIREYIMKDRHDSRCKIDYWDSDIFYCQDGGGLNYMESTKTNCDNCNFKVTKK